MIQVEGATVGDAIVNVNRLHPELGTRLIDESGAVRSYINLFANDEDIRFLGGFGTPVQDGDEVTVVPAIAGG